MHWSTRENSHIHVMFAPRVSVESLIWGTIHWPTLVNDPMRVRYAQKASARPVICRHINWHTLEKDLMFVLYVGNVSPSVQIFKLILCYTPVYGHMFVNCVAKVSIGAGTCRIIALCILGSDHMCAKFVTRHLHCWIIWGSTQSCTLGSVCMNVSSAIKHSLKSMIWTDTCVNILKMLSKINSGGRIRIVFVCLCSVICAVLNSNYDETIIVFLWVWCHVCVIVMEEHTAIPDYFVSTHNMTLRILIVIVNFWSHIQAGTKLAL